MAAQIVDSETTTRRTVSTVHWSFVGADRQSLSKLDCPTVEEDPPEPLYSRNFVTIGTGMSDALDASNI